MASALLLSQRSLHNAPIFRLLLKVAVNGTHQCESLNFCGAAKPQQFKSAIAECIWPCCLHASKKVHALRLLLWLPLVGTHTQAHTHKHTHTHKQLGKQVPPFFLGLGLGPCHALSILAEGAIALSVTLSGGALFAS